MHQIDPARFDRIRAKAALNLLNVLNAEVGVHKGLMNYSVVTRALRILRTQGPVGDAVSVLQIDNDKISAHYHEGGCYLCGVNVTDENGDTSRVFATSPYNLYKIVNNAAACEAALRVLMPLQVTCNRGLGSSTLKNMIYELAAYDLNGAWLIYDTDGDKLRQYEGIVPVVERTVGCRIHGIRNFCGICAPIA